MRVRDTRQGKAPDTPEVPPPSLRSQSAVSLKMSETGGMGQNLEEAIYFTIFAPFQWWNHGFEVPAGKRQAVWVAVR